MKMKMRNQSRPISINSWRRGWTKWYRRRIRSGFSSLHAQFLVQPERCCAVTAVCCPRNSYNSRQESCGLSTILKSKSRNALTTSMYVLGHILFHFIDWSVWQKRLKQKVYQSAAEFAVDVELIFSNATTFNQDGTQIFIDAVTLRVRLNCSVPWVSQPSSSTGLFPFFNVGLATSIFSSGICKTGQ